MKPVDKLREKAKKAGIKSWHIKSAENLRKELEGLEEKPKKPKLTINITKADKKFFDLINFDPEWLSSLANQYGFNKLEYMSKFKAFRCYINDHHVEWIDVNDLSILNKSGTLCEILLKHQPVSPSRAIIKLPWKPLSTIKINDVNLR